MTNTVSHFAINADDLPATRRFYETVFGWHFTAFGPPDFYRIDTGGAPAGAIQKRRNLVEGQRTVGYECTIAVADIEATARTVVEAGGRIIMERTTLAGVGDLIFFADPSGNVAGAMQYDSTAD
jgi:predicted enzyme related to lactoylglutathione lyase